MTQEEKELLLKDLCARLPYRTYVSVDYIDEYNVNEVLNVHHIIGLKQYTGDDGLINIKPYLRPMSSMTDNEMEDWYRQSKVDYDCEFKPEPTLSLEHCHLSIDWLNKYGFDYRGLIPMGLALKAPEGMYNIKGEE